METERSGSNAKWWWLTGILSPIIVGVTIWLITGPTSPFHPQKPPSLRGTIDSVNTVRTKPCCRYNVEITTEGYIGKRLRLLAYVENIATQATGRTFEIGRFTPETSKDELTEDVNVPIYVSGTFQVRFIIVAPNGVALDQKFSNPVTVYSSP